MPRPRSRPRARLSALRASRVAMFTRNTLCAVAVPKVGLTTANFLERLLDPSVKLGTSTPKADPAGDYTWEMFRRADALRPGSYEILDKKAQQIVGGPTSNAPVEGKDPAVAALAAGKVDVVIGYCTSGKLRLVQMPELHVAAVPSEIATGPEYGLAVLKSADPRALDLALFMLSPEGQQIFSNYGLAPVGLPARERLALLSSDRGSAMDGNIEIDQLALAKFGIGQPVPRNEDPMLVCGQGQYTDDINLPGQAYAVIVRSRYAHGVIDAIDSEEARAMPGVLGVYTGPDLSAAGMKPMPLGMAIPTRDGTPMHRPARSVLTSDRVRYVGDPVAIVVAETAAQAKDAAEAVVLDVETLPAVTRASEAAAPGAPQLHDEVPGNVAAEFHYGDADKVAAAFADAAHVTRLPIPSNRIVVCPMEPCSAIAD